MKRLIAVLFAVVLSVPNISFGAGRRPPQSNMDIVRHAAVNYSPRVEKMADRYRLVLESEDPLPHYLIEKNQKKIWVRLARPSLEGSQILEGDSVIREVRLVSRSHSADMILQLGDDALANDVYFDDGKKKLVVDIFTSAHVQATIPADSTTLALKPTTASPGKSLPIAKAEPKSERRVVQVVRTPTVMGATKSIPGQTVTVVVDAGHGGMDSGAIGTRGTLEKDINLEFARALAKQLAKEKNFKVIMTRDSDEFIPLSQRTEIANKANADIFISIHCNSSLSPKHTGFETYILSLDATDKAAESVARLENSVVALEAQKGAASSRLSEVLASMAVGSFVNESSKCAAMVCRNIRNKTSVEKAEVKEADFYVLRGAQMPAVLIELEYLSNPVSELKLRSSRYRAQLVKGVTEGIKAYNVHARQEREALAASSAESLANAPQ